MSPSYPAPKRAQTIADAKGAEGEKRPARVRVTVLVQNRYTIDTDARTGKQIEEALSKRGTLVGMALAVDVIIIVFPMVTKPTI